MATNRGGRDGAFRKWRNEYGRKFYCACSARFTGGDGAARHPYQLGSWRAPFRFFSRALGPWTGESALASWSVPTRRDTPGPCGGSNDSWRVSTILKSRMEAMNPLLRSSGRESALTVSRNNHTALLATQTNRSRFMESPLLIFFACIGTMNRPERGCVEDQPQQ